VLGCTVAAVGLGLWAGKVTQLALGSQVWYIVVAGAGMGMMLTPASTDAVNRASRYSYGEATGITQTVRNYSASLGLAILGTISVSVMRSHVTTSLVSRGVPAARAAHLAKTISQSQAGGTSIRLIPHYIRLDFAYATQRVLYVMTAIMAAAALVALVGLKRGVQGPNEPSGEVPTEIQDETVGVGAGTLGRRS